MRADQERLTVLVTGASAGIGAAFAHVFARHGFDLILTARREERLQALAKEIEARHGVTAAVLPADLSRAGEPSRLVDEIRAKRLRVHALVNNAGYGVPGSYQGATWAAQQAFLEVLVKAPCELAHRLLPEMIEQRRGFIINVASVAGLLPGAAGHTLYGAAKSFLLQFSRSLHLENESTGVHVTAVCPGLTFTEFHDVTGNRDEVAKLPSYVWMTAQTVAEQGYRAVMRNKAVYVNGWFNKLLVLLAKYLPDWLVFWIVRRQSRSLRVQ